MNLPITMDDSIPQQAGPGAGAVQQTLEALELALHALVTDTAVPAARIAVTDAITALRAPLAVEDSRERCASSDAARYRWLRAALLSGGPEWDKLVAMLNIAPDTVTGVDDSVDAAMAAASSGKEN